VSDLKKNIFAINAVSIGNFAHDLLAQPGKGRVMGVTSRGFFFLTASNRVLFISADLLPGPVLIILTVLPEETKSGLMGAEGEYSPDKLFIPKTGFQINLKNAKVWQPPALPIWVQSVPERNHQIKSIIDEILKSGREATFLPLLKWLVSRNPQRKSSGKLRNEFVQKTMDLQQSVRDNVPTETARILDSWLGFGPGLTPSGDDFVWGFLLTLNRWHAVLCPQFEVRRLNDFLLPQAQQKTSSLSATLIECAAHGWADANMLSVLDRLFTGEGKMNDVVEKILAYGSSSGVDAFSGMVAAISAGGNPPACLEKWLADSTTAAPSAEKSPACSRQRRDECYNS
jgi:hypothetical protein